MDYINDGIEYTRDTYNAALDVTSTVYNAATSKTAQRTLLTTLLFTFLSGVLFFFACVGYLAFYHEYLPDQVMTVPVHLQYGYELNPYGVASLSGANFKDYQDYDISVTLNLPNSPGNLARGNFMLALYLLDTPNAPSLKTTASTATAASPMPTTIPAPQSALAGKNILFTSTRPAIMPYTDPLVSLAKRLLLLAYHVFVPCSETTRLVVPMAERLEFIPGKMMPAALVLDVQAGQGLQVYDVLVTVTAQLGGLRWFMHTWWVTSFVLFTGLFWVSEVFFLAATAVGVKILWAVVFSGGNGGSGKGGATPDMIKEEEGRDPRIKQEGSYGYGKAALEDVPMTFPTSSQQPPLRYEPEPGSAVGEDEGGSAYPQQLAQGDVGGEADVEDEAFGGEDYHHYREEEGGEEEEEEEDPHGRDSGIGTSFSERDGAGGSVRRRTSLRRMGDNN
ncbi:putative adipose-regulatory protein-domain-containing protein [Diaporthe sp. PMI_573]|nr:putative adipose-regulatory protein-domain-containing protein [Diaporthaceae sp. PMI_573]